MQSRAQKLPNKPAIPAARAAPGHKQSHGNITNFVRCLRLLDLDLLPDWPQITKETFSAKTSQQNLQFRCKAVEWSLYRLFEIYDSKDTESKLKPFFPPLAPLQSLNLRTALYRSLTELKKDGVLGKDVVLRKTMLDECKGDKFEEVVGTFAMIVLRKTCVTKLPPSTLEQTGLLPKEQLVPLILANRLSLQDNLKQRNRVRDHTELYTALLDAEAKALGERKNEAQSDFRGFDEQDLDRLREFVTNSWIGDDRWVDVLLEGRHRHGLSTLDESFEASWESTPKDSRGQNLSAHLTSDLSERIGIQEKRMKRWKTFQASLLIPRETKAAKSKQSVAVRDQPSLIRFDQHKLLHLDAGQPRKPVEEILNPSHQFLLDSMNEELAALHNSGFSENPSPLQHTKSTSSFTNVAAERTVEAPSAKFSKPTAVAASIQSVGDLKQHRPSPHPENSSGEIHLVPSEEDLEHSPTSEEAVEVTTIEFTVGTPEAIDTDHKTPKGPSLEMSACTSSADVTGKDEVGYRPHYEGTNSLQNESQPRGIAEHTRKSMADRVTWPVQISPSEYSRAGLDSDRGESPITVPPLSDIETRKGTLLERTRQSMLMLSRLPPTTKTRQSVVEGPHFSDVFPLNQFETPTRQQAEKFGNHTSGSGSSTPRDKLFSEEADYASVFKSRPRIALSPALSPERGSLSLDSMLDEGLGDLNLDEDNSLHRSPLRRRG